MTYFCQPYTYYIQVAAERDSRPGSAGQGAAAVLPGAGAQVRPCAALHLPLHRRVQDQGLVEEGAQAGE